LTRSPAEGRAVKHPPYRDSLSVPFVAGTPAGPEPAPLSAAAAGRLLSEGLERFGDLEDYAGVGAGTLWRWATRGKHGVKLEALPNYLGKGFATSRAAVARFAAALAAAGGRA
jgi:hypothetical protein